MPEFMARVVAGIIGGLRGYGLIVGTYELYNLYNVWRFNQTASKHDPRKVDRHWNWK